MNINDQKQIIIFDVDGTLINTLPPLVEAANDLLCQQNLQTVSESAMRSSLNIGLIAMIEEALKLQPTIHEVQSSWILSKYMTHYEQHYLSQSRMFPDVKEVLSQLSQYYRLAICTNRDQHSTHMLLQGNGIMDCFDLIITLNDVEKRKPHPEGLLKILSHYNVSAEQALFIGDSQLDCVASKAAQIPFIAHTNGYASDEQDLIPHIFSFQDYCQLLAQLTSTSLKG